MKKKLIKFPQSCFLRDLYVREKKQAVYKCLGTSTKGQELYLYMDACFVFFLTCDYALKTCKLYIFGFLRIKSILSLSIITV